MAKPKQTHRTPKEQALARDGALNPNPQDVRDQLFQDNPFFDPKDLVQVRYEMVRRHRTDGLAIRDVADTFGVSRPTFYKAQTALADHGLAGLAPRVRGPKDGHKISAEVISFVEELKAKTPDLTVPQYVGAIATRFGISVHRRTLERALARKKKKRDNVGLGGINIVDAYERLRAAVIGAERDAAAGLATLRRQGMLAWMRGTHVVSEPDLVIPRRIRYAPSPAAAPDELTLILASLVVTLTAESTHA